MSFEERVTVIALISCVALQVGLALVQPGLIALSLPALGLGFVSAVLALRSEQVLRTLHPKRQLLAWSALILLALFLLTLFIEEPRRPFMLQASRLVLIDCASLALGKLCASFIAGARRAQS